MSLKLKFDLQFPKLIRGLFLNVFPPQATKHDRLIKKILAVITAIDMVDAVDVLYFRRVVSFVILHQNLFGNIRKVQKWSNQLMCEH